MSEFYLVRHGQASFGSDNYDKLSPLGHQQSQWLGEYFLDRGIEVDAIVTGDMVRHRETAEGICSGLQSSLSNFPVFAGLNEFDFHSIIANYVAQHPDQALDQGSSVVQYFKYLKKAMQLWSVDGLRGELPESWSDFEHRVKDAITSIQHEFYGKKVLVVSSGGAISMALAQILKAPSETVIELNLQTKNTAIAQCFFNKNVVRITSYNHVPHLDTRERADKITYG
ncbi:histidine phosphatase family protein [Paraglaciecola sp. 20A4]|uniref:histidine phosphatase family protein n=1 Tax=Paraglaciecola sp. 20A4 TaxID=2687288 RepID=UPI0014093081